MTINISKFIAPFSTRKRIAAILIITLLAATGYWIYGKYFHLSDGERAKRELAAVVVSVSNLMILPEGDQPMLATVVDAEVLKKEQPFFTRAINGDQLLLFPRNLQAVLYRPKSNIIVSVGPIQYQNPPAGESQLRGATSNNSQAQAAPVVVTPAPEILSVEVRNGTGKTGSASSVADLIRADGGYSVVKVTDAVKKDYAKTIIFSRVKDGSQKQAIDKLVIVLSADIVSDIPEGEKNTEADALVILGSK
ncbi:MAG: LytR C-terminal domain-containing protein [bacterium]|nr:LytR C-terminal domain-containing protein [bacterium]